MTRRVPVPRRILVIQLRRLGDVVLSTALLEELRHAHPAARLDWLVGDAAAPLLDGNPLIGERIIYDRTRTLGMWREIRSRHYDWIIDVQSSPRTAPLTRVSGAPVRVGWDTRGWGWAYTHRLSRSGRPWEYVVRQRQRLLELVGVETGHGSPRLYVTAEERAAGEALARSLGATAGVPHVGLLLSAGERAKEWPPEHFAAVARAAAAEGATPMLFQSQGDAPLVGRFLDAGVADCIVVPPLPLRAFLGVLSGCRAFVSADTGPVHMAVALGVPTVTLFGMSSPVLWSSGNTSAIVVRSEGIDCAGCDARDWTSSHDCMRRIEPGVVMERVRAVTGLGSRQSVSRG